MYAVILIGAGTVLTDAWNGAPALYLGATTRREKASRVLQAVSRRAFRGLPLMVNGETEATKTLHRATPFSLTGTVTAVRIMWELSLERTEAVFIPLKEIQAMPARLKAMT